MLPIPFANSSFASSALSNATPSLLPNAIFAADATIPFASSAYAATITLSAISFATPSKSFITLSYSGKSYAFFGKSNTTSVSPARFSSGVIISCFFATSTANDTSVGGTSISLNVPDIESLPPIEGSPYPICASYAPRSAANG